MPCPSSGNFPQISGWLRYKREMEQMIWRLNWLQCETLPGCVSGAAARKIQQCMQRNEDKAGLLQQESWKKEIIKMGLTDFWGICSKKSITAFSVFLILLYHLMVRESNKVKSNLHHCTENRRLVNYLQCVRPSKMLFGYLSQILNWVWSLFTFLTIYYRSSQEFCVNWVFLVNKL